MSLSTAVPLDNARVFPGENFFFYWKTSASLWESKIAEFPHKGKILVPLNWSFHTETGDRFDYADERPESNLKRLVEIAEANDREIVFLLPLTPAPFLPNGGVPALLSRYYCKDKNGLLRHMIGPEDELIKLTSFFDPRVFQGFSLFSKSLGRYFRESGIACDVYGLKCGVIEDNICESLLYDTSTSFEMAFARFIEAKKMDAHRNKSSFEIESSDQEKSLRKEFVQTIEELYIETAVEALAGNWEGVSEFSFLGAGQSDFFNRLKGHDNNLKYAQDLLNSITLDVIPSSCLLSGRIKKGTLGDQLNQLISGSLVQTKFEGESYHGENVSVYSPLVFFDVFDSWGKDEEKVIEWERSGLWDFLWRDFRWSYKRRQAKEDYLLGEHIIREEVMVFPGSQIDDTRFRALLKHFMSGGKVVLDRSSMDSNFLKKFETFFLENSLKVEKVFFHTNIHDVRLGEGRLLIFEGDKLENKSIEDKLAFWGRMVESFEFLHLKNSFAEGIDFIWLTRSPNSNELKFEEVRRLTLYNPSSYKRYTRVQPTSHFVLTKVSQEVHAKARAHHGEVEIELLPEGSVSLDFGVFS